LGWRGFSIVVLFHLGLIAAMGHAWWLLGPDQAGPGRFVFGRYVRDSVGESLPLSQLGGFIVGARALVLGGVGGLFAAASTLVDLTVEAFAKLPYTVVGLVLLVWQVPGRYAWIAGGLALAMVLVPAGLIVLLQLRGTHWIERLAGAIARRMSGKWRFDPGTLQQEITQLYRRPVALSWAFSIHTGAWLLSGVELWITLHFMGHGVSMPAALVIDSLLNGLRGFAFVIPGALGVQEAGYVALGGLFGLSPETAIALSLVRRGRDLAYGIPGVLLWQAVEGRRLQRL
jgi:putative membrane protein